MDGKTLAGILWEKYQGASRNEAACQVHLFGIQYAGVLRECSWPLREIVKESGIGMGYLSEVNKGIKLARYVQLKEEIAPGDAPTQNTAKRFPRSFSAFFLSKENPLRPEA